MIYVMQLWTSILLEILCMLYCTNIVRMPSRMLNTTDWKTKGHCHRKMKKDLSDSNQHQAQRNDNNIEKHFMCLYQSVKESYLSLIRLTILVIYHNKNKWIHLIVHKWQLDHMLFSHKFKNIWCTFESQCKYAGSKCFPNSNEMLKFKGKVISFISLIYTHTWDQIISHILYVYMK